MLIGNVFVQDLHTVYSINSRKLAALLPIAAENLQQHLAGDYQIGQAVGNTLRNDIRGYLGACASAAVLNIGVSLTSQDVSIGTRFSSSKLRDTVPLSGFSPVIQRYSAQNGQELNVLCGGLFVAVSVS